MKTSWNANSFGDIRLPCRLKVHGQRLVLCLKQVNFVENRYENELWLLESGQLFPLDTGQGVVDFWWKNENQLWIQYKKEEGEKGVFLYEYTLQEPESIRKAVCLPDDVQTLFVLENGAFLFVSRETEALLPQGALEEDRARYAVLEELPFWEEGEDFFCGRRRRLFFREENGKHTAVSSLDVEECLLSEDGQCLWFTAKKQADAGGYGEGLFCYHIKTGKTEKLPLPTRPFVCHAMCEIDGGDLILFGGDMQKHGLNQNGAFYCYHKKTKRYTSLYEGGEHGCWSSVVSDVQAAPTATLCAMGEHVLFASTQNGGTHLLSLNCKTRQFSALRTDVGSISELAVMGGDVYYAALRGLLPPELYGLQGEKETRISAWNTRVSKQYHVQEPQSVCVKGANQDSVEGWVLPPTHRCEGKQCAAVLLVHGGPKMAYGPVLSHEMQYLASLGYAVLFCNPHGSDGRGDAFADIRTRYGREDCDDLLLFLDTVLCQNPWIDPQRIGICGGSYGGFVVNWLMAHTKRFAAAVSLRGISNWFSMAALSDIGHVFVPDQVADPILDPLLALELSPLRYAQDMETPTLFYTARRIYVAHRLKACSCMPL